MPKILRFFDFSQQVYYRFATAMQNYAKYGIFQSYYAKLCKTMQNDFYYAKYVFFIIFYAKYGLFQNLLNKIIKIQIKQKIRIKRNSNTETILRQKMLKFFACGENFFKYLTCGGQFQKFCLQRSIFLFFAFGGKFTNFLKTAQILLCKIIVFF